MKLFQKTKYFVLGMLVAALFLNIAMPAIAAGIEASLNAINIVMNGKQIAKSGENYTLDNGTQVPYSILYNGTTYLPLRKIGELYGKDLQWDGNTRTVYVNELGVDDKKETDSGDKASILSSKTGDGAELYTNYWNAVTPFTVDKVAYQQSNIYGLKIKAAGGSGYLGSTGGWKRSNAGGNLGDTSSFGLILMIDNSLLEYTTMKFDTAVDDFSRSYNNENTSISVIVYGYSPSLGLKTLYESTMSRSGGIYNHEVNIKGYEEIYVRLYSWKDFYGGWGYGGYYYYTCSDDYLLLFEPRMFK